MILDGVMARIADPQTFTPEQLQSMKVPILLILGRKDNLVGDPDEVKKLAQNIPDIQIKVLDSGHGLSIEQPDQVNNLILDFFGSD